MKHGSRLDLLKSVRPNNLKSLLGAGRHNLALTRYLIAEALQGQGQRLKSLATFLPQIQPAAWQLAHAGKRVQIIKRSQHQWGQLEFGTEIVAAADGSLAALLGASPGASVSVKTMLEVLQRCFPAQMAAGWQTTLKDMIPSWGESLQTNAALATQVREDTLSRLLLR